MRGALFVASLLLLGVQVADSQWVQTSGPEGGYVTSVASQNGFVFAGTSGAGIFRSADDGLTWTPMNSGYGYPFPTSFLVKGTRLFSATVGVYWTTDNGGSWTSGTGLPGANSITSLATDGTRIYAGATAGATTLGVFRSTDDGLTWQGSNTGLPDYAGIVSLCVSGSTVFATTGGSVPGVYRSTDQGITWALSGTGSSGYYPGQLLESGGVLFVGTSGSGVYRSTDNGNSWQMSNGGLPANLGVNALAEHSGDVYASARAYPSPSRMYRTTDGGASWMDVTNDFPPNLGTFALGSHGTTLIAGVYGKGIVRSTDNGSSWNPSNSLLINSRVVGFANTASSLFAVVGNDGVYRTQDNGANWTLKNTGIPGDYLEFGGITADAGNVVVMGVREQFEIRAFRSTDDGATWSQGTSAAPFFFLPQRIFLKDNILFVAAMSSGVYMSTDYGNSWTPSNNGIPFTTIDDIIAHGGDLFAAGNEVYRSTDDGASWAPAATGLPAFAGLNRLASTGSALYATSLYNANVYRTTNMGGTWTVVSQLPGAGGTDLRAHGTDLFAGVINAGVYLSTNGGTSWTNIRDGLPTPGIVFYSIGVNGTDLVCGTDIAGVWTRPLSEVTSVDLISAGIPATFALEQNYPNPFNPKTEIRFQISEYGLVTLRIFDILGKEAATIVREHLHAGSYSVGWEAAGLPGGVYFYQLKTGNHVETKKMVLLR